jgi:Predicted membrane-associated Zn-dependent proteases 1
VQQGSLAEQANLGFRDKIISIDEIKLDTFNEINIILSKRIGDTGSIDIGFIEEGSNFTSYSSVDITEWLSTSDQSNPAKSFGIDPLVPPVIGGLLEEGPASRAGLKVGDVILSVKDTPIQSWIELSEILSNIPNETASISVLRGDDTYSYSLKTDSFDQKGIKKGGMGIFASNDLDQGPQEIVIKRKGNLINAFLSGFTETYKFTNWIMGWMGKRITGSVSAENMGGPIQISVLAGSAAKAGLLSFWWRIAILGINLGLINLFPIAS